jgi:hypothetical protein
MSDRSSAKPLAHGLGNFSQYVTGGVPVRGRNELENAIPVKLGLIGNVDSTGSNQQHIRDAAQQRKCISRNMNDRRQRQPRSGILDALHKLRAEGLVFQPCQQALESLGQKLDKLGKLAGNAPPQKDEYQYKKGAQTQCCQNRCEALREVEPLSKRSCQAGYDNLEYRRGEHKQDYKAQPPYQDQAGQDGQRDEKSS